MEKNQGRKFTGTLNRTLAIGLSLAALATTSSPATTLLDDTFSDGSRSDQNLPTSSAWYSGGNASTLNVVDEALVLTTATTSRQAMTYFTLSGAPQTLEVGSTLTLSFSLSESAYLSSAALRFGLYNSGGTRVSADSTSNANVAFTNYEGYAVYTSPTSGAAGGTTLRARHGADQSLFSTTASVVSSLSGNASALSLTDSTYYNFSLSITVVSATEVLVGTTVRDSTNTTTLLSFSSSDTTYAYTSFDTFAFYGSGGSGSTSALSIDNIMVTYAVPEPGLVALFGLGAIVVLWSVRRSRTA